MMRVLSDEIQRRGIRLLNLSRSPRWCLELLAIPDDVTAEFIDALPTIQLRIRPDSGNGVMTHLYGRDYVGPISSETNQRLLLVRSSGDSSGRFRTLFGRNFVSQLALLKDNV